MNLKSIERQQTDLQVINSVTERLPISDRSVTSQISASIRTSISIQIKNDLANELTHSGNALAHIFAIANPTGLI